MPAKRAYGMDQEFYSWSPIVTRPILRWPEGARVALVVIVNLEHWDWEVPVGTPLAVSPMGGPEGIWTGNQPSFPDIGGYGNHEYGNRVGVFRILAVLDKYGIKPTLALDKAVADHYPYLVKEGLKRDAEFIAHGLSRRRIIHIGMSEDEEREYIRDSIEAVEKATGNRPIGWSGPDFQETPNTPNLLAAEGIRYVCDWGNDEHQIHPRILIWMNSSDRISFLLIITEFLKVHGSSIYTVSHLKVRASVKLSYLSKIASSALLRFMG